MKRFFRTSWLGLTIFAVLSLLVLPTWRSVQARGPLEFGEAKHPSAAQNAQNVYMVEIIVLNLSSIDLTTGTYSMDFYLMLTCETPPCSREPAWDILNSVSLEVDDQGVTRPFEYYEYRVKAELIGKVDYTFYPFDYLYVDLYIEDKEAASSELAYEFGSITVDDVLFNPAGWYHDPAYDSAETFDVTYGNPDQDYARLNVWLFLERDWFGAFIKTIFAAIVIVLIGMLSFLMKVDAVSERLALVSSTLVAVVLYHISLVSSVPATGYLTFTDKFMVWTYIIVFAALIVSVLMMIYSNAGKIEIAERIHKRTRLLIPIVWILIMIYTFAVDLFIPYNLMLSTDSGNAWWPQGLEWLADLLHYTKYLPPNHFGQ